MRVFRCWEPERWLGTEMIGASRVEIARLHSQSFLLHSNQQLIVKEIYLSIKMH